MDGLGRLAGAVNGAGGLSGRSATAGRSPITPAWIRPDRDQAAHLRAIWHRYLCFMVAARHFVKRGKWGGIGVETGGRNGAQRAFAHSSRTPHETQTRANPLSASIQASTEFPMNLSAMRLALDTASS
ncbi:hypothetical protein AZ78_3248 [Lysobacter capsici AZ78]|uniref:Uncharacterized protein n=1 Tax=Lysobacter capsici AZ78 TaxID=1444315 RepID=A0A108UAT0_9GAMM|nr:hypothetical protein AZ78_3248 [Lysobacter capsici AZ78]